MEFTLFRQYHRRDRLLAELYYKDNKRYQYVLEKLNMTDYEIKEHYPYKRMTKYDLHVKKVNEMTSEMRQEKLSKKRDEFERQKAEFFNERDKVLRQIQEEIESLGFKDIAFPATTAVAAALRTHQ